MAVTQEGAANLALSLLKRMFKTLSGNPARDSEQEEEFQVIERELAARQGGATKGRGRTPGPKPSGKVTGDLIEAKFPKKPPKDPEGFVYGGSVNRGKRDGFTGFLRRG